MTKEAAGCDLLSISSSHLLDSIVNPPLSTAPDIKLLCSSALFSKRTGDVSVPIECDLEAAESNSDLRPLEPFRAVLAPLSVPDKASFLTTNWLEKSATFDESPPTRRTYALGGSKLNLTFSFTPFSLAKASSSFHNRPLLADQSHRAFFLYSFACPDLR